jgi:class 3 adenylate cyclase
MDVAAWLKNLGLDQYEAAFRDNAIDGDVLPGLTSDDLKDIGVTIVGHRRKLLDAIVALSAPPETFATMPAPAATPPGPTATPPHPAPPQKAADIAAERRPVTVLFCDLVGSTALAGKLDAEDWRDLVGAYLDASREAVTHYGGHVLKKLGDGLMALFGYPRVQENDAERAVRAALAIQRALGDLNARNADRGLPELSARIGLDSGRAVVDAAGEVFGETPNVAARVEALAEPGAIIVTANVQRQVAGLFVVQERGPSNLKGVADPVNLFRIVRASGAGRRNRARALTPFVGREEELGLIAHRWERARSGEGQLVLIVGEPGIGKSRLIEEFHATLRETPHTWVEWSSSQLLQNTSLHPVAEWGRLRFGGAHVPNERRLAEIEASLAQVELDPAEYASLLAPIVDIPLPLDRHIDLPRDEMRRRQLDAIVAWVLAGARAQPVLLAFEDLQWADPSTVEVMNELAAQSARAPLLVVATTRPEFRPPWRPEQHHCVIPLEPLNRTQAAKMIGQLTSGHLFSSEVVESVNERASGVPLFIEEVTRLLLERGDGGGAQTIPLTLHQSLAARLDRLGHAREIAQIGAVLGREFSYGLLQAVAGVEDSLLQSALSRLAEADILIVGEVGPQANYRFRHALIQDAAYESLLKSRRQALHRRAAEILRDESERAAIEPEAIARHFTQAGLDELAIEWWGKAGEQALRRSAFSEAVSHLRKAIEMADARPAQTSEPPETRNRRLKLHADYAIAVAWATGYTSDRTAVAMAEARDLAVRSGGASERFASYYGQWTSHISRDEMRLAREVAEAFLADADSGSDDEGRFVAESMLGVIHYFTGHFAMARDILELATSRRHVRLDAERRFQFGLDIEIGATVYLGLALWILGDFERSKATLEDADRRAVELGHKPTLANARHFANTVLAYRGDSAALLPLVERQVQLCREHGMALYLVLSEIYFGWAYANAVDPEAGLARIRTAIEESGAMGLSTSMPYFRSLLAHAEMAAKHEEQAVFEIDAAIAMAQRGEAHFDDSPAHRIRGEILLRCSPPNLSEAAKAFGAACHIAQEQGARSFWLLAALPLAKLCYSSARFAEAKTVLASALEGLTPTPEMPETAAALALLSAIDERAETQPCRSD